MNNEVWKNIRGTDGKYLVSSEGRIKGLPRRVKRSDGVKGKFLKERMLKGACNSSGYLTVTLPHGSFFVHRIVAEAFVENPMNKEQVNHKDGNRFNNKVGNLEWVTAKENTRHAFSMEKHRELNRGSKNPNSILNDLQVMEIKRLLGNGVTIKEVAKRYEVSYSCIRGIKAGVTWKEIGNWTDNFHIDKESPRVEITEKQLNP